MSALASSALTICLALGLNSVAHAQTEKPPFRASGDLIYRVGPSGPIEADGRFEMKGQTYHLFGMRLPSGICDVGASVPSSVGGTKIKCADLSRGLINSIITTKEVLWQVQGNDALLSTAMIDLLRAGWLEIDPALTREEGAVLIDAAEAAKRERQGIWRLRKE
jgi:hypothetical protein